MKQKFIEFLKKHNAYDQFLENLESEKIYNSLDHLCRIEDETDWVSSAFTWTFTPEGIVYWDDLDDLWYNIVTFPILITKDQFIDFLKENNLYEEFLANLKNGEISSLDELCKAKEPYQWIIGAFEWFKQDQHWKVWDKLDQKWQETIGSDFLE